MSTEFSELSNFDPTPAPKPNTEKGPNTPAADPFASLGTLDPSATPTPTQIHPHTTPIKPGVTEKGPSPAAMPANKIAVSLLVGQYADKYGVPRDIAFKLVNAESSMDNSKIGPQTPVGKAVGIMQLMPKFHPEVKDPTDINQNLDGGMAYLSTLYKKFGNWTQAVAAYNAGPARIPGNEWTKINDTRNYVDKILGPGTTDKFKMSSAPLGAGKIGLPQAQTMPQPKGPSGFNVPLMSASPQQQAAFQKPQAPPAQLVPPQALPQPTPPPAQAKPAAPPQGVLGLLAPQAQQAVAPPKPQPNALADLAAKLQVKPTTPPPGPGAAVPLADAATRQAPPHLQGAIAAEAAKPPERSLTDKLLDLQNIDPNTGKPVTAANPDNIKFRKPQNPLEWAQVYVNSLKGGMQHGLTGITPGIGGVGADRKLWDKMTPQQRKIWLMAGEKDPYAADLPTSKTLDFVGDFIGTTIGAFSLERGLTGLGQFVARESPELARVIPAAGSRVLKFIPVLGEKALPTARSVYQYTRLMTPAATGFGGLNAIKESMREVYTGGYWDPKHVGEEFANSAAGVYLMPGIAAFAPQVLGKTVGLAPLLARFIPESMGGGAPLQRAIAEKLEGFKPLALPGQAWRGTAKLLQQVPSVAKLDIEARVKPALAVTSRLAQTKLAPKFWQNATQRLLNEVKGAPPGIWEHAKAINNVGYWMDNIANEASWMMQFPTYATRRGGGNYPPPNRRILEPDDLWNALDVPIERRITRPAVVSATGKVIQEAGYQSVGGGVAGKQFQRELGGQIKWLVAPLVQAGKGRLARLANTASQVLTSRAGRMSEYHYKVVDRALTDLLDNAPHFSVNIPKGLSATGGVATKRVLNEEGRLLESMRDLLRMQSQKGSAVSTISSTVRSGVAHTLLGMGNILSAVTLGNRLSFPLATEGVENTTRALNEMRINSKLYKDFRMHLGQDVPAHAALTGGVGGKLSRLSFSMYDAMENKVLPSIGMARYFTSVAKGASHSQALADGLSYARGLRTNVSYDVPQFLRQPKIGEALKVGWQFFPFAFKSLTEMGGMNLRELANHSGYMMALSGIKSVPMVGLIDKAIAHQTGMSFLNVLMADPKLADKISGLPGWLWGADDSARHNVFNAMGNLIHNQPVGATGVQLQKGFTAWDAWHRDPKNATLFFRAVKANLPAEMQNAMKALDDDQVGQYLNSRGFPIMTPRTPEEERRLGGMEFLGVRPTEISSRQAIEAEKYGRGQFQSAKSKAALDNFGRAVIGGDSQAIAAAAKEAVAQGVSGQQLRLRARQERTDYLVRQIKESGKPIRKGIIDLVNRFRQGETERAQ